MHGPTDDKFVWANGFFDWNGDGDWDDFAEHVFALRADPSTWVPMSGGWYVVDFNMPPAPPVIFSDQLWTRFRLDYGENLGQPLAPPINAVGPAAALKAELWRRSGQGWLPPR